MPVDFTQGAMRDRQRGIDPLINQLLQGPAGTGDYPLDLSIGFRPPRPQAAFPYQLPLDRPASPAQVMPQFERSLDFSRRL